MFKNVLAISIVEKDKSNNTTAVHFWSRALEYKDDSSVFKYWKSDKANQQPLYDWFNEYMHIWTVWFVQTGWILCNKGHHTSTALFIEFYWLNAITIKYI